MRVFVLSTGRCGSKTFATACSHLENYSSGHETRSRLTGRERLAYPDGHIEADNRLCWLLGRLDREFGGDAFYVHLTRSPEEVARSFAGRWVWPGSILKAYRDGIHMRPDAPASEDWALDYIETVTENIRLFLKDKPRVMSLDLAEASARFPDFLSEIGAEGDLEAACREWSTAHNATRSVRTPPPFLAGVRRKARALYRSL